MSAFEQHYTPDQVAKMWGFSTPTIRTLFEAEEGVILITHPETRTKRRHRSMRIPASVVSRVHGQIATRHRKGTRG